MLGQKKDFLLETRLIERSWVIEYNESCIDPTEELYLLTWCPDPKELPDSDFYLQHNMNVSLLSDYLKACACGLFCVESTQQGNPHYHGWYQVNPEKEIYRISLIKTLKRFGDVRIVKSRSHKVNSYNERKNSLYYYKKDLFTSMLAIDPNPITCSTESTVNFEAANFASFFSAGKVRDTTIADKISDRKFYREFYADSLK